MKRKLLCVLLASLAVMAPSAAHAKPAEQPNVVVVMTDDQDFRSMSAMPQTRKLIGRQGTTFDSNFVNYPLCCPSRATYLTGEYAHNHGVLWNNFPEGGFYTFDGSQTLPIWMRNAGYSTIHIGKYLNEYGERDPLEVPAGWDEWYGGVDPSTYGYYGFTLNHNGKLHTYGTSPRDYSTDVYARLATKEIRRASKRDKPFFLSVAPNAPHTVAVNTSARQEGTPAVPAPRDADAFADAELPRYPNFNEADISDKPAIEAFFPNPMTDDDIASLTDHYRGRMGSLLAVDDLVGNIEAQLRRSGVARDTVVIFTSDNGWILGEHRLHDFVTENGRAAGVKYVPYDGSARVPLMIAGPGFPKGLKVKSPTVNADLARTIAGIAGAKTTLAQDGQSLLRIARHPDEFADRAVLIETAENPRGVPPYVSIRTERYRYDLTADGFEGLYDYDRDPWELQSVHDDPRYAAIKQALAGALAGLRVCAGASCRQAAVSLPEPTGEPFVPN